MQQNYYQVSRNSSGLPPIYIVGRASLLSVFLFMCVLGCGQRPSTLDEPPAQTHRGTTITIAVPDASTRELVEQLSKSWAARTGSTIKIVDERFTGQADIGMIRPAEMPKFADEGKLAVMPSAVRGRSHPYQWDDVFSAYTARLLVWKEKVYALPVRAEGMVLVYRRSAFDGKEGRPNRPPQTWDELAQLPLTPLPTNPELLSAQFLSAVACYDRPAINRITSASALKDSFFRFLFDPETGAPRVSGAVFERVARTFQAMYAKQVASPTAHEALQSGKANAGVLTLAELAGLPTELTATLGIAPLPGSIVTFDQGKEMPTPENAVNRVPYFGWGGLIGVVSASSAQQDAAWEFLLDVGNPEQTGSELIASARWGAGPYRVSHVEAKSRPAWFGYRLSTTETDRLLSALRENMGLGVQNYRFHLRTPNQHELMTVFNEAIANMIRTQQDPKQTFAEIERRWKEMISKQPAPQWRSQARASLGI